MGAPFKNAASWKPILPVPDDAPSPAGWVKGLAPDDHVYAGGFDYRDAAGRLLCAVVRYNSTLGRDKEFKPFTFCEGPNGAREWRAKAPPEPRPLYGLDLLAARPDAPVLVCEGEKAADAARELFPAFVAVSSMSGSKSASKADWRSLAGRDVTIWPDADEAGAAYARAAAEAAHRAGAASVRVVRLPDGLREGWDLADELPEGVTDDDLRKWLDAAEPVEREGPLPLFPPLPPAEPFPIEALGGRLGAAAAAISRTVQVPDAIAAQSVLAVAALAAQAHADVRLPYGQTRPLSLFMLTVASSGDRKSTADNEALRPVREREKALAEAHARELEQHDIAKTAYAVERRRIENNRKLDMQARKAALAALGPEPPEPLIPLLTAPEPTLEGLLKMWKAAPAALGIFTAEGGVFIGGHGMSEEARLRTAAGLSELWDGTPVKRVRALDGVSILPGRRLSLHLLVQPEVAAQFLADPLLRDQGLLSRVLVAAPDSIAGSRPYREPAQADVNAIAAYSARVLAVLEARWPMAKGKRNELEPRVLRMSAEAEELWIAFYNHVEGQCGQHGDLRPVRDFANKAAEHAARIAGVLTIIEDHRAEEIGAEAMDSAIELADWYLREALRLSSGGRTDERLLRAKALLDWLHRRGEDEIAFRDILQFGPGPLRTKAAAESALGVLSAHEWVEEISERPRLYRVVLP